jgi:protocatechuate 3,4-dioxygenase beta subunit
MKLTLQCVLTQGIMTLIINILIISSLNSQNFSVCPIGVGTEPTNKTEIRSTSFVNEIFDPNFVKWTNLKNVMIADDKKADIVLSDIMRSRKMMGNNLKFQIPAGATINGITLMLEGQSSMYQNIDEVEILLLDQEGEPKGQNKKNTSKLQKAWGQGPNGSDRTWMYGSATDSWGADWTPQEINNENFGYQIQIRNIERNPIQIAIDQISIIVHYTPAYSFCDDKCLTFYIDKYEQYGSYIWDYPEGFNMVSASLTNQTIDLKITTAPYGVHKICVDVFDYNGQYVETCCRNFLYQDCTSSEIKGIAWLDLNNNQLRDGGEGILSNVPLILFTESHTPVDTLLTDDFGKYHFKKLPPGNYYIKAPFFNDKQMVLFNPSDPSRNSDITNQYGLGTTSLIAAEIGQCVENIDFGYTPLVSIGDFVWLDKNYNGLQDAGEPGIKNVKVKLCLQNGAVVDSTVTDIAGRYTFQNYPANKYILKFDIPADFKPTYMNGASVNTNSKIDASGKTQVLNLITSGYRDNVDAGFYQTAKIGDQVWEDKNGNGIFNSDEPLLSGVPVKLSGTAGNGQNVDIQTITDTLGKYSFNVNPGVYTITFTPTQGYTFTLANFGDDDKDSDAVDGKISDISVMSGDLLLDFDAGLYRPGSLSNFVWIDDNGDGIQNINETGLEGVKVSLVELVRDEIVSIGMRITDINGYYIFDNLKPGVYRLLFELPNGYQFTSVNVGNDDTKDSDVTNGLIDNIMLMSGENNDTYDAGLFRYASVGDYVWEDSNANGIQEPGEHGKENVTIRLNGISGSGETISLTKVTDSDGEYIFTNLAPGVYSLSADVPSGFSFSASDQGSDDTKDSDGIEGVVTNIIITSSNENMTVDFGIYSTATLGDLVWEDMNGNGIFDTNEPGLADIKLNITGTTGAGISVSNSVTTDTNGKYNFTNLVPGVYNVELEVPAGYNFSAANRGSDDSIDSDFSNGVVTNISLRSGENLLLVDGGLFRHSSLGDFIWDDLNANGVQDLNEPGLASIQVLLTGTNGVGESITSNFVTSENGFYEFDQLEPGTYNLVFNAPDEFKPTIPNNNFNDQIDSDPVNGSISDINILSGTVISHLDAGFYQNGQIGNFVWEDINGNGIQDTGEPGLSSVQILLSGTDGTGQNVSNNTVSDASGQYNFENLVPGNYTLMFVLPSNYSFTTPDQGPDENLDSDVSGNTIQNFMLRSGQDIQNMDAGAFIKGSIGDFVWEDINGNGIQDQDEQGIGGIKVDLQGNTGSGLQVNLTVNTDQNGRYIFDQLMPGIYSIVITKPDGYQFSPSDLAGDDDKDSDGTEGVVNGILINSNTIITNIDFGLTGGINIGDFVWEDLNTNGIQDIDEPGIPDINITLQGTTSAGIPVFTTIFTDADGQYLFANVNPGNYTLTFDLPSGYLPTRALVGIDPEKDSNLSENMNSFGFTIDNNISDLSLDVGLVRLGSIGDLVWEDLNCNGIRETGEPGVAGVVISIEGVDLFSSIIQDTTTTDVNGNYLFSNLKPGFYVVTFNIPDGYEFSAAMINIANLKSGENLRNLDAPLFRRASVGDFVWNDINENGIQEFGEPGMAGVKVTLTGILANEVVEIETVTDADGAYTFELLKPGTYSLAFEIPDGYVATSQNTGTTTEDDSDIDDNGSVIDIVLLSNQNRTDIDAGLSNIGTASIGDFVWEDLNGNGIQDTGEPGIAGVRVRLEGTAINGSIVSGETITNGNGRYIFNNLFAGEYTVTFIKPSTYEFSSNSQPDDETNSDPDPVTGKTEQFTILSGSVNTNIDAGLFRYASLGDFVWNDLNKNGLQDAGEPGVAGVNLRLVDQNDLVIATLTTGNFGFYFFSNIAPGTYRVEADLPDGFMLTNVDLTNNLLNSDFYSQSGKITTEAIDIASNNIIFSVDLGLITSAGSISGSTWNDTNGDGILGNGEALLDSIIVYLLNISGDTLAVDTTNAEGFYSFENLPSGQYVIRFSNPDNVLFTYSNLGINPAVDSDVTETPTGSTAIINLAGGQNITGVNAGYVGFSSIGDFVWVDSNENGIQDVDEDGLNGIKIKLYNQAGILIDSTASQFQMSTGISGYYIFDNLPFGQYFVEFSLPNNFMFTNALQGNEISDSDIENKDLGRTSLVNLFPNQNRTDIDGGYILVAPVTGSIRGLVWQDADNNKLRGNNEVILSGIEVTLFDLNGNLIANQTSASDGTYMFTDIPFGDYYIKVPVLSDKVFVLYSGQSVPFDSDITNDFGQGSSRILNLFPGATIADIDLGYAQKITIGDFVWDDLNNNGLQDTDEPGIANVEVRLINEAAVTQQTVTTNAEGKYIFNNVAVGKYTISFGNLSDYIFASNNSADNNLNSKPDSKTGRTDLLDFTVQQPYTNIDAGYVRPGKIGDMVWLDLNGNGFFQAGEPGISNIKVKLFTNTGILVDSTVTGNQPGGEFVGFYQFVKVRPGSYYIKFEIPSNYLLSPPFVGGADADSNISGANGPLTTDIFSVGVGQTIFNIDAAAYLPAELGDRVWNDINKNGTQDAGEPGVPDVTVRLFTQTGQLLGTTVTNAQGLYFFNGLRQRLYYLQFSIPDGFEFTEQNASGNNGTDSDVDETGTTPLISLAHGTVLLDIDAGIHVTNANLLMGNVWNDKNQDGIRNDGESLMKDIKVYLKNADQQIIGYTTTNHAGMYCLSTELMGEHYVTVEAPENHVFTDKNAGTNPDMDSDVDDLGASDMIMLDPSYIMKYVDAGTFYKISASINGIVWKDNNNNGLRDENDGTLSDVVIFIFKKSGIFVKSTKSNQDGTFTLKNLDAGQYYCLLPEYDELDFVLFTGQNQDKDSEITNQYGIGTSRLITVEAGSPVTNFDFGYKDAEGLKQNDDVFKKELSVYPNPSLYNIQVKIPGEVTASDYYIVNTFGSIVRNGKLSGNTGNIDIENLPPGKYSLHIVNGKEKWAKTFMKIENR